MFCAGTKSRTLARFVVTRLYRRRILRSLFRRIEAPAERGSYHDQCGKRPPHALKSIGNDRSGLGRASSGVCMPPTEGSPGIERLPAPPALRQLDATARVVPVTLRGQLSTDGRDSDHARP